MTFGESRLVVFLSKVEIHANSELIMSTQLFDGPVQRSQQSRGVLGGASNGYVSASGEEALDGHAELEQVTG